MNRGVAVLVVVEEDMVTAGRRLVVRDFVFDKKAQEYGYSAEDLAAVPEGLKFAPLMTLYLTDRMPPDEIRRAREAGARVVETDWPGYGPQVARGFSLATSDWVLSLDADERISPALRAEVLQAIRSGAHDG